MSALTKKYSGDNQQAPPSTQLPYRLIAQVLDANGYPVAGVTVTFAIGSKPGGATDPVIASGPTTDVNGLAYATIVLGSLVGIYTFTATASGYGVAVTFTSTGSYLASNAILALADVKTYLAIPGTDTAKDLWLQGEINGISSIIEDFIHGPVVEQLYDGFTYDGTGQRRQFVLHVPLTRMKSGYIDGPPCTDISDVQWRFWPTDYFRPIVTDPAYILIKKEEPHYITLWTMIFPCGDQNLRLFYYAGYPRVPGAMQDVAIEHIAEKFKESSMGTGRLGIDTMSQPQGMSGSANTKYYDLSEKHKAQLWPYVRRRV